MLRKIGSLISRVTVPPSHIGLAIYSSTCVSVLQSSSGQLKNSRVCPNNSSCSPVVGVRSAPISGSARFSTGNVIAMEKISLLNSRCTGLSFRVPGHLVLSFSPHFSRVLLIPSPTFSPYCISSPLYIHAFHTSYD